MKIKTSDLTGAALRWAVAKAEGHEVMLFDQLLRDNGKARGYKPEEVERHLSWQSQRGTYVIVELKHLQLDQRNPVATTPTRCAKDIPRYDTDWAQGGPIIEREKIRLTPRSPEREAAFGSQAWMAGIYDKTTTNSNLCEHPTPLIAAMRCYVASKLGDEIEVPDELVQ